LKFLLGAFAIVSITSCITVTNKGFCQKSTTGYNSCLKEKNITCRGFWCNSSGVSEDLTVKKEHWIVPEENFSGEVDCRAVHSTRINCVAALHFNKIFFN